MTNFDITIETLYTILSDAAKYSPVNSDGRTCKQLQTFRVLQTDRGGDLSTPAMGAKYSDRNTPYFFSRSWDRAKQNANNITADFPALTAFELNSQLPKSAFDGQAKQIHTVEVAVVDVYKEECQSGPKSCDSRSINQIYMDTETLLLSALQYLAGAVIATTSANDIPELYNETYLQHLLEVGKISGYDKAVEIGTRLAADNKGMAISKVEMPAQKLYGTRVVFSFAVTRCLTATYSKTYPNINAISHEGGCVDCG